MSTITRVKDTFGEGTHYTVEATTGDLLFKDAFAFQAYAQEATRRWEAAPPKGSTRPCMYLYRGLVFDIVDFVNAHPGGATILEEFHGKDITVTFHNEYNYHGHTQKALNMLLQYRVGRVLDTQLTSLHMNYTAGQQEREYEIYKLNELTAYPRMSETEIVYKDFTIRRDRGLIWQAMHLTLEQYFHLINTPIYVPYCRLFDWPIFEPFSRTPYWLVATLWAPLGLFFIARGLLTDYGAAANPLDRFLYLPNHNAVFASYPYAGTVPALAGEQYRAAKEASAFSVTAVAAVIAFGVLVWTLLEYMLHRFVFHFEKKISPRVMQHPLAILLHMVLHGIHHIIPMDPDRLVFPPVLFVVVCSIIYYSVHALLGGSFFDIAFGSAVLGYVAYDEIHYYIHHADPQDFYFNDLKKFHHAHHYVSDERGFGISNKLWDIVFGTLCRKA